MRLFLKFISALILSIDTLYAAYFTEADGILKYPSEVSFFKSDLIVKSASIFPPADKVSKSCILKDFARVFKKLKILFMPALDFTDISINDFLPCENSPAIEVSSFSAVNNLTSVKALFPLKLNFKCPSGSFLPSNNTDNFSISSKPSIFTSSGLPDTSTSTKAFAFNPFCLIPLKTSKILKETG